MGGLPKAAAQCRGGEAPSGREAQGQCDHHGLQMQFSSLRAGQRVPRDSNPEIDYKLRDINQEESKRAVTLSL